LVAGGTFTTSGLKVQAKVDALCVDVNETTAAGYAACVAAGTCTANGLDCAEQSTYGKPDRQDNPIVCVTFEQAQAYCGYAQKRLPRTEEWEWIARGTEAARKFPWGDEAPAEQLCWSGKKAQPMSCVVGSHPAGDSPHGIHDLAGNVLEFTTTAQDPKSKVRIARGGSWRDGAVELVRVSRVGGFELSYRCGFLGIRCVKDVPPPGANP
jgi:formylglycine-generating enzyme required for sulfatase activity